MPNKNKKMKELVDTLKMFDITTRDVNQSCAQRVIDGCPEQLVSVIHDEDCSVKGGVIECGIHIEGRFVNNNDIINALKKLKCWLPNTQNSINIDRPKIFNPRWAAKHPGQIQGRWFIYGVFDKNVSVKDIAFAKKKFKNEYMKQICEAINKNFN